MVKKKGITQKTWAASYRQKTDADLARAAGADCRS
jgi:hypothetical protein